MNMYLDEPVIDRAQMRTAFIFLSTNSTSLRTVPVFKAGESSYMTSAKKCSHYPQTFRGKPEVFQDL